MTNESLIIILELLFALTLLMLFFRGPWQSILVDITRQRLFEVRDNIFLYAENGKIDFNSETYKNIRDRINSAIRFCHHAKLSNLIAALFAKKNNGQKFPGKYQLI
ncbi:MAG: hypothetical protein DHS20C09_10230 [marine bacterium B5-7]|nr:MAG: hypothetical protein DHS20C09_10230 [marine bacterium B5-7]